MEILNTTRFVRILAEPTWDYFLLLLFLGVSLITRFENDFFQPILPTWWRPFCFGTKTPHRQWWNYCGWDIAFLLFHLYVLSLEPIIEIIYFGFILSCCLFLKKSVYHLQGTWHGFFTNMFRDFYRLVYNAWHLHIFFCPSLKSICPSSFSGSSFVLSWFSKIHI